MENLEISKFVTSIAIAAVTVLIRYIYSLLTRNGEKMKIRSSSVDLIDKVINEREWKKQENRLVVEEAFEQLYSKPITFNEIKVLIYSETPNAAFRTYLKYRSAIEFNENKTKFRYRKEMSPYWALPWGKVKIPRVLTKGVIVYFLLGLIANYTTTWLLNVTDLATKDFIMLWLIAVLTWLMAIIFLIRGLKYHGSEKDLIRDLGDKFFRD